MKIKCKKGRYLGRDVRDIEHSRRVIRFNSPLTKMENGLFDLAWREAMKQDLKGSDFDTFLVNLLLTDPRFEKISENAVDLDWLTQQIDRCQKNVWNRVSRFENVCYLSQFNYFVTLTYDSAKIGDEATFRVKIRKALSNMAFRFHWLYKGIFERGEDGDRLHVHLLLRAEKGQMPGELETRSQYSKKRRRMEFITANTFFDKFGRNEFRAIDPNGSGYSRTIHYLTKYMSKSGERLFGSKNLTHEIERRIDTQKDVMYVEESFGKIYVLYQSLFWTDEKKEEEKKKNELNTFVASLSDEALVDWYFVNPEVLRCFADRLRVVTQTKASERIELV